MSLAYYLYMAQQENCFPDERQESIEACIKDFRTIKEHGYNPNDYISQVLDLHNLKEYQLSKAEIKYINQAVNAL